MNYLYSQDCVGSCVEGCSAGFFVPGTPSFLTYNRNVIKLWKYKSGLILVKEHVAFENVCQVEKYRIGHNHDGLILLFSKAKVSLVKYNPRINDFEMQSLKFFEREEFDIREEDIRNVRSIMNIGMFQMSKYHFSIFPLYPNTFSARVFKFVDVGCRVRNPIDFVFLENYSITTVCLVYNSSPRKYTSIKNYDALIFSIDLSANELHVVDEFLVPPRTFKVACSGAILLFLSPNSILMRSTNSSYTLALNRMSESYGNSEISREVVLSDVTCFFRGNSCLIFNGNGDRYKLRITMDIKRIIKASLEFEGREATLSCIDSVEEFVFLGSVEDSSRLMRLERFSIAHPEEQHLDSMDVVQDDEYAKMFCSETRVDSDVDESLMDKVKEPISHENEDEYTKLFNMDSAAKADEDFSLTQLDEVSNIGSLNGVFVRGNEAIFTSDGLMPSICVLSDSIKLDVIKAVKIRKYLICSKALDFYLLSNENETRVLRWDESLQDVEGEYSRKGKTLIFVEFGTGVLQVMPHACLVLDNNLQITRRVDFTNQVVEASITSDGLYLITRDIAGRIVCYDHMMAAITTISDVTCFTCIRDKILVLSGGKLIVFDLNRRINVFWSGPVNSLPPVIRFSAEADIGLELAQGDGEDDMVVEMCCCSTKSKVLLLLRSRSGIMIAYELLNPEPLVDGDVEDPELLFFKIRLCRCVSFDLSPLERAFYVAKDIVFIKSAVNLFMIPTDKGYFLYKSHYSLNSVFAHKSQVLQLSRGYLALCNPPSQCETFVLCSGFIAKRTPIRRIPKHIEYADGYIVVASCEEIQFSSSSERDCGVPVYTYKFYVDLYSAKYEHISTYELDENEYVFHIRYLILDDKQGNNGKSPFLVVCTSFVEGEDKPAKGRLHVLEIISVVPELENPFKDCKLKVLGVEKTKGSIVQCEEVRGNIVLCLGTKIMIYKIDRSSGIIPVGFHDLYIFTSSISVVKNYILASDVYRGISFFYLQSKPVRLHLISSSEPLKNATSVEFLITDDELSMVCCDDGGTIHIYTYSPNNILSLDGTRLVKRAEIRTKLGRLFTSRTGYRRGSMMLCSKSNVLVQISGVEDMNYYRLQNLQALITGHLRNTFGLNPKDYLDSDIHLHSLSLRNPIALHILNEFCHLDMRAQESICASTKMSKREIVDLIASLNL